MSHRRNAFRLLVVWIVLAAAPAHAAKVENFSLLDHEGRFH